MWPTTVFPSSIFKCEGQLVTESGSPNGKTIWCADTINQVSGVQI